MGRAVIGGEHVFVKVDRMVHIECSADSRYGGGEVAFSIEDPEGNFTLPETFTVGPFDLATDVGLWLARKLVAAGVLQV